MDISDLAPGSLIVMRTYTTAGEYLSSRFTIDPFCLYIIIKKLDTVITTHRYMTFQGIVRLFESDFVNCDENKVLL